MPLFVRCKVGMSHFKSLQKDESSETAPHRNMFLMYVKKLRIRFFQTISKQVSPLHQASDAPAGQCDPKPTITSLALITVAHDEMDIINLLGRLRVKLALSSSFIYTGT